ncbi:MAG: CheY-like chemotaxis protein, partial [Myxococcota bacterium]
MQTPPTRVLIVEDEAIIAAALAVRLEGLGYDISATVADADQVLTAAVAHPPDVALMDIHLKGARTGIDAAGQLQSKLGVPVVYTTAYADAETLAQAKLTVPYGYLLKPYDDSSLKVAIELAVYRCRAERQRRALELQLLQAQKLEAVGRLASGIAHDFNNLLTIIYGISEMIELHPQTSPKLLPDLRAAVDRGSGLIRRLMLFSRTQKAEVADVDVCEALASLRKLLQRLMGVGVQLRVKLHPQVLYARLDPLQLD